MHRSNISSIKIWAGLAVVGVLILGLLGLVVRRVPTVQDARVSKQIQLRFEQAISTNFPADRHITVIGSPRHNATVLFLGGGALTAGEKQKLTATAEQIGQMIGNRRVEIVFREQ